MDLDSEAVTGGPPSALVPQGSHFVGYEALEELAADPLQELSGLDRVVLSLASTLIGGRVEVAP